VPLRWEEAASRGPGLTARTPCRRRTPSCLLAHSQTTDQAGATSSPRPCTHGSTEWRSRWPPLGEGAAAPGGALRAIDPSARPRSWRTLRSAPPAAAITCDRIATQGGSRPHRITAPNPTHGKQPLPHVGQHGYSCTMRLDDLPAGLPPGRLVTPDPRFNPEWSGGPVCWASQEPLPDAPQQWARLQAIQDRTGLRPVLFWPAGTREPCHPWRDRRAGRRDDPAAGMARPGAVARAGPVRS
jgi:hypothetical protein